MDKKELALWAVVLIVGGFIMALQIASPTDDAYVSFVYARNLADGNGLVFNLGEHVEGYSNFLWVVLLAFFRFAGSIPVVAICLGFLLGLGCVFLIYLIARQCGCGPHSALAGTLVATDLNFAVWCVKGLETPLYVFLILLSILLYIRERSKGWWALPALLAGMTRPEGAAVFGVIALHRAIVLFKSKSRPDKADAFAAAMFFIPFIAYNVWRYIYFDGSILPNTYYARGGGAGPVYGALYILFTFWDAYGYGVIPLIAIVAAGMLDHGPKDGAIMLWLAVGSGLVIINGGDWMPHGRFIVPVLPFMYLAAAKGGRAMKKWRIGLIIAAMCVGANIMDVVKYEKADSFDKLWSRKQSAFYMPVSDWLSARAKPGDPVALSDVGYVKYYSGVYVIDTLGLTDKHLARMPGGPAWATDVDYTLDKRPLFIVSMVRHYGDVELGHTEFDRKIAESERFKKEYRFADELEGYEASERALGDLKVRRYNVTFRIYGRRNP